MTGEGVFSYDFKTDALTHYVYRKGEPGISNNNVNSIFATAKIKYGSVHPAAGLIVWTNGRELSVITTCLTAAFQMTVSTRSVRETIKNC